jgi:hypothetical protein
MEAYLDDFLERIKSKNIDSLFFNRRHLNGEQHQATSQKQNGRMP